MVITTKEAFLIQLLPGSTINKTVLYSIKLIVYYSPLEIPPTQYITGLAPAEMFLPNIWKRWRVNKDK